MVRSKLLKKKFAAFGKGGLSEDEIDRTPFLVSLSNDPMLNMAVKIYLVPGQSLRIGRKIEDESTPHGWVPDLQIDGLGIEASHCVLHHQASGEVSIISVAPAITYVNGLSIATAGEEGVALSDGDRVVLGVCSHIFAFVDPRVAPAPTPSHEQAVREVILGRVETESERKERLAALV